MLVSVHHDSVASYLIKQEASTKNEEDAPPVFNLAPNAEDIEAHTLLYHCSKIHFLVALNVWY